MKALLDTNILIDYLNGVDAAKQEIALYDRPLISPITWIEVMVGALVHEEKRIRVFLARFTQIPIVSEIAEKAVLIRRQQRIRLPDAIIWASARYENALLVTRNSKDFPAHLPEIRIPYTV